jgi:hypothetical protein
MPGFRSVGSSAQDAIAPAKAPVNVRRKSFFMKPLSNGFSDYQLRFAAREKSSSFGFAHNTFELSALRRPANYCRTDDPEVGCSASVAATIINPY